MKPIPQKTIPRAETMATNPEASDLDHFFSVTAARLDRWRDLGKCTQAWVAKGASAAGLKAECARRLEQLRSFESFQAFPGLRLLKALEERVSSGDAHGTLRMVQRVSSALMSRSYRGEAVEG